MTNVTTYRVLLRERPDSEAPTLERTYRSLVPPKLGGGPYLSQEGDVFVVERPVEDGEPVYGLRS